MPELTRFIRLSAAVAFLFSIIGLRESTVWVEPTSLRAGEHLVFAPDDESDDSDDDDVHPAPGPGDFLIPRKKGKDDAPRNNDALPPSVDRPTPLDPINPRTPEEKKKTEALARYMTGRLKLDKTDLRGAYTEFEKAVELDPNAIAIYRELVPLAFDLKKNKEAMQYAEKAVQLDPNDFQMLHRIGRYMAEHRNLPEAMKFLEKAAVSTELKKKPGEYVMLMRDLAVLYTASEQKAKAADAWQIVLDALIEPAKFGLEYQERTALQGDSSSTFEAIGQVMLDAERLDSAVKAFEAAAKARRGNPGHLSYNLARVYVKTKQSEKALAELQKYFDAQLQSKGRGAYDLLAEILKSMNRSDELIGRLETLAKQDPRNSTLQFFLADAYVTANRLEEARHSTKRLWERRKMSKGMSAWRRSIVARRVPMNCSKSLGNVSLQRATRSN
nr:TPR domain-containing protein [uncultured bacterium]